jgi:hypothetical protein
MIQAFNPVSFDAFAQLLARPDPADLPRRAHVCKCEGDPNRRETRLPAILMGWLQRRHLDADIEEPLAAAKRTWNRRGRPANPGLRVLPRTGTDD